MLESINLLAVGLIFNVLSIAHKVASRSVNCVCNSYSFTTRPAGVSTLLSAARFGWAQENVEKSNY